MRLGRVRRKMGRALRGRVRLGKAYKRKGRALQVRIRLRRELRVRVKVIWGLRR
jgi:hypothetical protein